MNHLLELVHRLPQARALGVDGRIIHQQLVLAVGEAAKDLRNVGLGAAILVEIAVDGVAERDDAEELARLGRALGVELLDGAAKLGEVRADARVLVDRLDRAVKEAVRSASGLGDLLAAHRGQLIDLLAEFWAVGVEGGQLIDELIDAPVKLAGLLGLERDEAGRLRRRKRIERFGRIELQLRRGLGLGRRVRGHLFFLVQALVRATG